MSASGDFSGDESRLSRMAYDARSNLVRHSPCSRLSPNQVRRAPWSGRSRSPSPVISNPDRNPSPPPLHAGDLRHSIPRETRDRSPNRRSPAPDDSRRIRSHSGRADVSPVRAAASAPPPAMMVDLLKEMDGMREAIAGLSRRSNNAG